MVSSPGAGCGAGGTAGSDDAGLVDALIEVGWVMGAFFGDGVFWGASAAATVVWNRTSEATNRDTVAIQRRMSHRYPHRRSAQPPIAWWTQVRRKDRSVRMRGRSL